MSLLQSEWRHQGGATHPIETQHQSWFKFLLKSGKAGNSLARGDNRDLHLTKCRGRGSPKLTLLSSCCFSPIVWTLDIIMDQCLHFTTAAMQAPKNNNKNNTMPTIKHDTGSVMIEGCSGPQRIAVTVGTMNLVFTGHQFVSWNSSALELCSRTENSAKKNGKKSIHVKDSLPVIAKTVIALLAAKCGTTNYEV